jgi:hypothetical protein
MSILYPVAANAEAALHAPRGYAARERGASALAGGEVVLFVTETVGPTFETQEAALDAYAGRVDDERPGRMFAAPPEARWCDLKPVTPNEAPLRSKPVKPVMKGGRRWPVPDPAARRAVWRLAVSYWRIGGAVMSQIPLEPARRVRKDAAGETLDARTVRALTEQPMRPFKPQQPLDIGLFETRPPEAPHIVMPDE